MPDQKKFRVLSYGGGKNEIYVLQIRNEIGWKEDYVTTHQDQLSKRIKYLKTKGYSYY